MGRLSLNAKKGVKTFSIGNKTITLPSPMWQFFEYQNQLLVVLDPDFGMKNVICYDHDGNTLWTIAKATYFKEDGQGYDAIYLASTGQLKGHLIVSCRGRPFFLNLQTGEVEVVPNVPDRM